MLERLNPALRIVCLALAAIVVLQVARLAARHRTSEPPVSDLLPTTPSVSASPGTPAVATPGPASTPPGMPVQASPLPPDVQAQVDRIVQSEVLGPVQRPLPMALLGLAGRDAIVRTPDGRTGLLRVGEEFGGVKLLQIGTNRVLIEHERQQKELTLFSGFGSESLLTKEKERH